MRLNNEGFAMKSFLIIIGLLIVIIIAVFLIRNRDPRTGSITELYERYLQDRSIENSEGILSEEMILKIKERGPVSILCTDVVPDDAVIEKIEENEGVINVFLNYLEEPIRIAIEDDGDFWKIVRIDCPSVNFETETETETEAEAEEEAVVEEIEPRIEEEIQITEIPAVSRAKEDLSVRLNLNIYEIELVTIEAVIFSDLSLGTSSPGEMYGQVLTPGYIIILSVNEKEYRYHADGNRAIFIQ